MHSQIIPYFITRLLQSILLAIRNKPFKGSFNVRIGSDLHREAMMQAQDQGINLNEFVKQAIETSVHH